MGVLQSGVKEYVTVTAEITMKFPIDLKNHFHGCCAVCNYYSKYDGECEITKERTIQPNDYVGGQCPFLDQFPQADPVTGEVFEY